MEQNQIIDKNKLDKNKQLEKDIRYIQEDMIAYQKNGLICKVSKPLNCITITNLSKDRYIKYWQTGYKGKRDVESGRFDKITKACEDKLLNNMYSLDKIIEIELSSKDLDSEKQKLIEEITMDKILEDIEEDEDDL